MNQQLINAYRFAGDDFLARRLKYIFIFIETEEDRVLHNDALKELMVILGETEENTKHTLPELLKEVAYMSINPEKKSFLRKIADTILKLARIN